MVLENKLGITNSAQLADAEEKLTKNKPPFFFRQELCLRWKLVLLQGCLLFTVISFPASMISLERSVMSIVQRITFNLPPYFFRTILTVY